MSTIITPSEDQINIVITDDSVNVNITNEPVVVNVTEEIIEVSTVSGAYPLPTTVYSVFGRTGSVIAQDGDYDLGELGDVTLVNNTNGDVLTFDGTKWINKAVTGTGTVTSVDMTVPVGLEVSGNPITLSGTLAVNFTNGYSIPTNAKQTNWDSAYNDKIISADVSGTTSKTLTLHQQDGGTIVATWTDIDTNLVTSVNGYLGDVVLTTTDIAEGTRLYYTEARVSANVDVAANTAKRHDALTIGTANGLSLSSQVLSLALASASTTGALSSTDWSTFNNKVPYTGATGDVNLGEHQLLAGQITFDQSPTGASGVGIMRWNNTDGTLDLGLKGGNVTLQLGQEIVARVVNKTGSDLLESGYNVVRISNAQGQRLAVQLAQANNDTNSTDTIGIVTETIENNQEGFITILGQVREINTTGSLQGETWADGDVLYLSPTTAGRITNIKPLAPQHMVVVGYVEYAHSQHGKIYCKVQNGYELEELHDCYLPTYVSNGVLYRDTTTNLWKNASIPTVLGYTPANDVSVVHISGAETITGAKTFSSFLYNNADFLIKENASSTNINGYANFQVGAVGTSTNKSFGFSYSTGTGIRFNYDVSSTKIYTLPNASGTLALTSDLGSYITLASLSATEPLSYNNLTGNFSISQAGVSSNGYLSSTDWNTFNNKQASGNYITSLTGEATASGPGAASVTLSTSAVTGKLLTGINITGGSISATDSILVALGKAQNQINALLGGSIFQTTWNASTNTPSLTSSVGTKGFYYIVDVAGSTNLNGITDWKVGDWAIFDGSVWRKVDNTDAVSSVNGFTGAVSLTTDNISEGLTNLYYTESRVNANTNVAANTAARHAAVTLGTANGLSLSTQQLSLGLSSSTTTGALSSTDWSVFNAKQAALNGTGFVKISGTTISYDNSTYYLASNPNGYTTNTGTVTSVATTGPITGGTITGSGTIGITQATTSTNGYLSSTDWNTFNNKQSALTNPVTGTGTANYLPKFTGTSTIGNSLVYDNGSSVGINTGGANNGTLSIFDGGSGASGSEILSLRTTYSSPSAEKQLTWRDGANIVGSISTSYGSGRMDMNFGWLYNGGYSSSILMKLTGSGNLGLGVTPTGKLHIALPTYSNEDTDSQQAIFGVASGYGVRIGYNETSNYGVINVLKPAVAWGYLVLQSAGGNVGIGTTTYAGYKLDVNGTGRFSGALTGTSATFSTWMLANDGTRQIYVNPAADFGAGSLPTIQVASNHALQFATNNTLRFTIASTGAATFSSSVTATTLVANKLQISQTTGSSYITSNVAATTSLDVINTNTTNGYGLYVQGGVGSTSYALNVVNAAGTTDLFKVLGSGAATFSSSVGIGGATPSALLHVGAGGGAGATNSIAYLGGYSTGVSQLRYIMNHNGAANAGIGTPSNGGILFGYGAVDGTITGEWMRITTSGNVGIGTTSPSSKLTSYKTVTSNFGATGNAALALVAAGSAGEANLIQFGYDAESWQPAYIGYLTTSGAGSSMGDLIFGTRGVTTNSQPTERMRITSGGVAQIANASGTQGTLVGSERLNVNGGIYAYGDITSGGTITFANNVINYGGNTNYKGATGSGDVTLSNNGSALLVTGPLQKNYGSSIKFVGNGSSSYDVDFLNAGFTTKTVKVLGSVHLETTDSSFVIPRMTTTQRDALNANNKIAGAMIYNTSVGHFQGYNGTGWTNFW